MKSSYYKFFHKTGSPALVAGPVVFILGALVGIDTGNSDHCMIIFGAGLLLYGVIAVTVYIFGRASGGYNPD